MLWRLSNPQIAVLRNLFGVLPALFYFGITTLSNLAMLLDRQGLLIAVIRSASVAIAQFCFYNALTRIEFATAFVSVLRPDVPNGPVRSYGT